MCHRRTVLGCIHVCLLTPTLLAPIFSQFRRTEVQDAVDSCHVFSCFTVKCSTHRLGCCSVYVLLPLFLLSQSTYGTMSTD